VSANTSHGGTILCTEEIFEFFRMGLAIGVITKEQIIAWADREINLQKKPEPDVIELSLSGQLKISQVLWCSTNSRADLGAMCPSN
jgi:hypothetical protein